MAILKDLLVNGPSSLLGDVIANKLRLTSLEIPTSSGGTSYSTGTSGQVLMSNGTNTYWQNGKITIAGNAVSLNGSLAANTLRASLGLSSALCFQGIATVEITDESTTNPNISGYDFTNNKAVGDVVIYSDKEFVWTGSKWEQFGRDSSFKLTQTAVSDPSASGTGTTFINSISQNANGEITVTKTNLDTSGTWTGNVNWDKVQNPPSTYTPSSHTHGNITNDGKLTTANRLVWTNNNNTLVSDNHYVDATHVVINGTTRTEITSNGYVSYPYALEVNGITMLDPSSVFKVSKNLSITENSTAIIQSPIPKYLWHDLFAFGRLGNPTCEIYKDGVWSTQETDLRLFIQKDSQTITVLRNGKDDNNNIWTENGVSWTWNCNYLGWSNASWLLIGVGNSGGITNVDNSNTIEYRVTVSTKETSDSNWLIRHESVSSVTQKPRWLYLDPIISGACQMLKITIERTSTSGVGTLTLSSIRLLTSRFANQGAGSDFEYPYAWDEKNSLIIEGSTNATMTGGTDSNGSTLITNPKLTFRERQIDGYAGRTYKQPVHIVYTDYDSYRPPAGLKIMGNEDSNASSTSSPAWLEIEGNIYANKSLVFLNGSNQDFQIQERNGNLCLDSLNATNENSKINLIYINRTTGNLNPGTTNTYGFGDNSHKWQYIYTNNIKLSVDTNANSGNGVDFINSSGISIAHIGSASNLLGLYSEGSIAIRPGGVTTSGISLSATSNGNTTITPSQNETHDLGSASYKWNNIYTKDLSSSGNISANTISNSSNITSSGNIILQVNNAGDSTPRIIFNRNTSSTGNTTWGVFAKNTGGLIFSIRTSNSDSGWSDKIGFTSAGYLLPLASNLNLGSSSTYPWNKIYANNYYGTWDGNTISVSKGGTGKTTLSSTYVLVGNGTGAITDSSAIQIPLSGAITIERNLIPSSTNTYGLGNSANKWANLYTEEFIVPTANNESSNPISASLPMKIITSLNPANDVGDAQLILGNSNYESSVHNEAAIEFGAENNLIRWQLIHQSNNGNDFFAIRNNYNNTNQGASDTYNINTQFSIDKYGSVTIKGNKLTITSSDSELCLTSLWCGAAVNWSLKNTEEKLRIIKEGYTKAYFKTDIIDNNSYFSFVPAEVSDYFTLGESTSRWGNIYTNKANILNTLSIFGEIDTNLYLHAKNEEIGSPTSGSSIKSPYIIFHNSYGSTGYAWTLYNKANILYFANQTGKTLTDSNYTDRLYLTINSLSPSITDSLDLGNTGRYWDNLYVNTIYTKKLNINTAFSYTGDSSVQLSDNWQTLVSTGPENGLYLIVITYPGMQTFTLFSPWLKASSTNHGYAISSVTEYTDMTPGSYKDFMVGIKHVVNNQNKIQSYLQLKKHTQNSHGSIAFNNFTARFYKIQSYL